jgi:hypothetical protein
MKNVLIVTLSLMLIGMTWVAYQASKPVCDDVVSYGLIDTSLVCEYNLSNTDKAVRIRTNSTTLDEPYTSTYTYNDFLRDVNRGGLRITN